MEEGFAQTDGARVLRRFSRRIAGRRDVVKGQGPGHPLPNLVQTVDPLLYRRRQRREHVVGLRQDTLELLKRRIGALALGLQNPWQVLSVGGQDFLGGSRAFFRTQARSPLPASAQFGRDLGQHRIRVADGVRPVSAQFAENPFDIPEHRDQTPVQLQPGRCSLRPGIPLCGQLPLASGARTT